MKNKNNLKVGKFKKKSVYEADVDMDDHNRNYFLDLGTVFYLAWLLIQNKINYFLKFLK